LSSAQKNGRGGQFCFADFFAGPGGLSLGFELTDSFTPVYAVDADKHAAKTYKENRKNLGVEVLTGPVSSVSARDVLDKVKQAGFKRLGAVLAGPPLQALQHGKQKPGRIDGPRPKSPKSSEI